MTTDSKAWERVRLGQINNMESTMSSEVCLSLEVSIHGVSSSVPSYPVQWTRYNSFQAHRWLSILESRIWEISNSGLSSTRIGGGRGWTWSGIGFRVAGSNMETWKTRCTAWRLSRICRVEWVPRNARISYSPRNLLEIFLEGWVIWKNLTLTYTWLPILNSGARSHHESVEVWYWHWALAMCCPSCWYSLSQIFPHAKSYPFIYTVASSELPHQPLKDSLM